MFIISKKVRVCMHTSHRRLFSVFNFKKQTLSTKEKVKLLIINMHGSTCFHGILPIGLAGYKYMGLENGK